MLSSNSEKMRWDEVDINEHVSGPFDHSEVKVLVVNSTLLIPKSFIID